MYTEREWLRIQAKEQQEIKKQRKLLAAAALLLAAAGLLAFLVYYYALRSHDYTLFQSYDRTDSVMGIGGSSVSGSIVKPFAGDLCVVGGDVNTADLQLSAYSAGLFDLNRKETLYAKDVFTRRSPASITKIMTALVTPRR